jgi:D-alanyl-D-alanine carboxypeptidase
VTEKLEAWFRIGAAKNKIGVASIAIWRPGLGYWAYSGGKTPSPRFPIASVTKVATGAVILQLVDERKLALDQTIERWFPDLPNASLITIDQLLSHTSGLPEWYEGGGVFWNSRRYWPADEFVARLSKQPPGPYCPGAHWFYSNINYVLLSRIAERVEGTSFPEIVDARVAKRLGLTTFGIVRPGDDPGSLVPSGERKTWPIPTMASYYGSGAAAGTAEDMLALIHGWATGRLMSIESRNRAAAHMRSDDPVFHGFGEGIALWDVPDKGPDSWAAATWIGHNGGGPGTATLVIYDATRNTYLAAAFNRGYPMEAMANELLKLLDTAAPRSASGRE